MLSPPVSTTQYLKKNGYYEICLGKEKKSRREINGRDYGDEGYRKNHVSYRVGSSFINHSIFIIFFPSHPRGKLDVIKYYYSFVSIHLSRCELMLKCSDMLRFTFLSKTSFASATTRRGRKNINSLRIFLLEFFHDIIILLFPFAVFFPFTAAAAE